MRKVLLALQWYDPLVHRGVADYSSAHGWHLDSALFRGGIRQAPKWSGDGVVTWVMGAHTHLHRWLVETGVCAVNIEGPRPGVEIPYVKADLRMTVQMGFDFLTNDLGFKQVAFVGESSSTRGKTFKKMAASAGVNCSTCHLAAVLDEEGAERTAKWLAGFSSTPTGVYCNNDHIASHLVDIALSAGIDVPDQVAVLGTDNCELVCLSSAVHISSIDTDLYRIGYRAAQMLDDMMNGGPKPADEHLPPIGVVERASTDTYGARSPHVRHAIGYMRRHYSDGITVGDVVAESAISQTGLINMFKRDLNRLPSEVLREIRLKAAARLLETTSHKVPYISHLIGLENDKYFITQFRKRFGIPPHQYRKSRNSLQASSISA